MISRNVRDWQVTKTVFRLYALGDLRAQGLFTQRKWWQLAFFSCTMILCVMGLGHTTQVYLLHPLGSAATWLAILSLVIALILLINALSVGVLSGTSGKEEQKALRWLPFTMREFLFIRVFLGVFRSEVVTWVIGVPCCLVAIWQVHPTWLSFICAVGMLIVFPVLPAMIGIWFNARVSKPRLIIWINGLLGLFFVGSYLGQQYPVAPPFFRGIATLLSLPMRSVLFLATPQESLLFVLFWFSCSVLLLLKVIPSHFEEKQQESVHSLLEKREYRFFRFLLHGQSVSYYSVLGVLALKRIHIALIAICASFWSLFLLMIIRMLEGGGLGGIHFSIQLDIIFCALFSPFFILPVLGLLLSASLGDPQEHRLMQSYPMPARVLVGVPYCVALLVSGLLYGVTGILISLLLHNALPFWFSLAALSSSIGAGSLLVLLMLVRQHLGLLCVWGLAFVPYLGIKLLIALTALTILPQLPIPGVLTLEGVIDVLIMGWFWHAFVTRYYHYFLEEA